VHKLYLQDSNGKETFAKLWYQEDCSLPCAL